MRKVRGFKADDRSTHMTEEDLEKTEGEDVDWMTKHLEPVGWPQVNDKDTQTQRRSCHYYCLINSVEHGLRFFYKGC